MTPTVRTRHIYEQYVKALSPTERLQLLSLIAGGLVPESPSGDEPEHSIMELRGLGAEIWKDVEPQEYVNALRAEWDNRP